MGKLMGEKFQQDFAQFGTISMKQSDQRVMTLLTEHKYPTMYKISQEVG